MGTDSLAWNGGRACPITGIMRRVIGRRRPTLSLRPYTVQRMWSAGGHWLVAYVWVVPIYIGGRW